MIRQRIQWMVLAVLVLAPLASLALNFYVMASGYRSNIQAEAAVENPAKLGHLQADTTWGLMKTLFQWRAREGERGSFAWGAWLAKNKEYALTNFTSPVLLILFGYLLYWLIAHIIVLLQAIAYWL